MGKQLIILILATIIIISSIFLSLSNKQLISVDMIASKTYTEQARHIANTFAHVMMLDMKTFLDDNEGDISNLSSLHIVNQRDICDVPNSLVNVQIHRNSYNGNVLNDTEFLIASIADVTAPDGTVFSFETNVLYEYVNIHEMFLVPIPEIFPLNLPGQANSLRFDGDRIQFYPSSGGNIATSNWNSLGSPTLDIWSTPQANPALVNFPSINHVILQRGEMRIIGISNGIDRSIMIICDSNIHIQANLFPTPGSGAKIVIQSRGNITIGTPNPHALITRIEADLYAMGTIGNAGTRPPNGGWQNVVTGTVKAGEPQLYMWDIDEHPDGPPEYEEEWDEYIEYRAILRNWSEQPIRVERN